MASHRRPRPASRARVSVLTATAAAAVALSSQAANASPKPNKDEVKSQVDSLYKQTEQATNNYDASEEQQSQLQSQVNDLQNKVAREQSRLNKQVDEFGQFASAQYRSGGIDPSLQLMLSSDPSDYLAKATMLKQLSSTQAATLQQMEQEKRVLDQERTEASVKLTQLQSVQKQLKQQKDAIQGKLTKAQDLLNTLSAADQRAIQNAGAISHPILSGGLGSGYAAAALAAGETKIGDWYLFGATGPSRFDCSGFVQWSYAQAGISLPRTSYEQENVGPHLTMNQLQPGDIVIMNGGEHVGLFAGWDNGTPTILHAPHTGAQVRYESLTDGFLSFDFGVRVA